MPSLLRPAGGQRAGRALPHRRLRFPGPWRVGAPARARCLSGKPRLGRRHRRRACREAAQAASSGRLVDGRAGHPAIPDDPWRRGACRDQLRRLHWSSKSRAAGVLPRCGHCRRENRWGPRSPRRSPSSMAASPSSPTSAMFRMALAYNMLVPGEIRRAIGGWSTDPAATVAASGARARTGADHPWPPGRDRAARGSHLDPGRHPARADILVRRMRAFALRRGRAALQRRAAGLHARVPRGLIPNAGMKRAPTIAARAPIQYRPARCRDRTETSGLG